MTPARMAEIHFAAFGGQDRPWPEAEISGLLDRPIVRGVTHGADAFALLQILPPEAEILTFAVDPSAQGRGIGTALLGDAIQAARDAGAATMFLEVAADNAAARALYARAGFAETGLRRGYYARPGAVGVDALILTCALTNPRAAEKTGTSIEC
jgi:ribosomal-protein-alanine N-acetyltransferase